MSEITGIIPSIEPQKEYLLLVKCTKCGFSKKMRVNDSRKEDAITNAQSSNHLLHELKCPNGPIEPQDISVTILRK